MYPNTSVGDETLSTMIRFRLVVYTYMTIRCVYPGDHNFFTLVNCTSASAIPSGLCKKPTIYMVPLLFIGL